MSVSREIIKPQMKSDFGFGNLAHINPQLDQLNHITIKYSAATYT